MGLLLALWWFIDDDRENIESTNGTNLPVEENTDDSNFSQRLQLDESVRSNEGEGPAGIAEESAQAPSDSDTTVIRFEAIDDTPVLAIPEGHDHIVRQWKGAFSHRIDKTLWEPGVRRDFSLVMPEGGPISLTIRDFKDYGESRGVYVCELGGNSMGTAFLSYVRRSVSGSIQNFETKEVWELRNAGGGKQYLSIIDLTKVGGCAACAPSAAEQ